MIHPKVCVQVIDQCVDRIQRYQSERRYSMKKMKLIKSKKMLTVLLTATAAMAVTPMAGYAETVQTKQIVNQSSEATVEVLSGNCGPVDEEGILRSQPNGVWKRIQKRRNSIL